MSTISIPFFKMHGLGNDFVVFDQRRKHQSCSGTVGVAPVAPDFIRHVADRRRGVGADQVIFIEPDVDSDATVTATAAMRIFNLDGSEVGACGNATRCVAGLLMAELDTERVRIRTPAGILQCCKKGEDLINVDMGPVITEWSEIPLAKSDDRDADSLHFGVDGFDLDFGACSLGNQHVVAVIDVHGDKNDYTRTMRLLETHSMFPERTNVEFITRIDYDKNQIEILIHERGSGRTPASGSCACGAWSVACLRGLVDARAEGEVVMEGGSLLVHYDVATKHVTQTGSWVLAFRGTIDWRNT